MESYLLAAVIVVWIVARQLQPRPVKERSGVLLTLVLLALGVCELSRAVQGTHVPPAVWALTGAGLVFSALLGAARGLTVKVWRGPDGPSMGQGHALTVGLWIVAIAVHLGTDWLAGQAGAPAHMTGGSFPLSVAVSLGLQREIVRMRAARIALPAYGAPVAAR